MKNSVTGEIEGAAELRAKLKAVSTDVKFKGGRFALRKAGQVVTTAVVGEMMRVDRESTPEQIWRNVALRWSPRFFKKTGDLMFRIGIQGGARAQNAPGNAPGGKTFHWRFLEFGTQKMPAQRNMTRAIRRTQDKVLTTFRVNYVKRLDAALRKAKKR